MSGRDPISSKHMTAPEKKKSGIARPPLVGPSERLTVVYLVLLSAAAVFCFLPLLKYFFAQDDFILMNTAVRDGLRSVTDFFSQTPGHFRPLTKGVYFGVMYRIFGLNPVPFHAVSIILHVANMILFFLLMRRVRVSVSSALVSSTLFALSVAFFHIVAWISCVQQLLGQCFMLAALIWGIDYVRGGVARDKWLSVAAYVLALLCVEQTFGVPAILLLYVYLSPGAERARPAFRKTVDQLSMHLGIMILYLVFIGVWKRAPSTGDYAFSYGVNVLVNFTTYVGWTLHFAAVLPTRMATGSVVWSISHFMLALLVVYHVARGRWREVVFGLFYFVVTISPTLFLANHTFYLHTYIPAFGVLYWIALFVDDVFSLRLLYNRRARLAVLAAVLAGTTAACGMMIRKNEHYDMLEDIDLKRSFVLRRAEIAENIFRGVTGEKSVDTNAQKVYMVYAREEGNNTAHWNYKNVVAATGRGSLINLIYKRPQMPVTFKVAGDPVKRSDRRISDFYLFDDYGHCWGMKGPGED